MQASPAQRTGIRHFLSGQILRTRWGREAARRGADPSLRCFRPNGKIYGGIAFMLASYVLGWPMVGFLGALSLWRSNPWIVAIGGPAAYGFSHLLFLLGLYLAGADPARNLFCVALHRITAPWGGGPGTSRPVAEGVVREPPAREA